MVGQVKRLRVELDFVGQRRVDDMDHIHHHRFTAVSPDRIRGLGDIRSPAAVLPGPQAKRIELMVGIPRQVDVSSQVVLHVVVDPDILQVSIDGSQGVARVVVLAIGVDIVGQRKLIEKYLARGRVAVRGNRGVCDVRRVRGQNIGRERA